MLNIQDAKRPRIKNEVEEVQPTLDVFESKPTIATEQEIDLWRLGC
jgi:hypothetical protein